MSLSGNHEYHTRSKNIIHADPPDLLSALSKIEFNLMFQSVIDNQLDEEVVDILKAIDVNIIQIK